MIMSLQNAIQLGLPQSMAAGAASLSDSSISSARSSSSSSSRPDGQVVAIVEAVALVAIPARALDRAFDARDEVTEDLFGDEEGVLELGDRRGRRLEQDDLVRALAVAIDRVGQPAAAPGRHLDDLAAGGNDLAGRPVDEGLALVIRHVRAG